MSVSNVKPDVTSDPLVQSWLNEFLKPKTKRNYTYAARLFFKTVDMSPSEFVALSQREIKQTILDFQKKLKDQGVSDGMVSVSTIAMRSFLTSQDVTIKFRRNQLVTGEVDKSSHVFSNGDLRLLFEIGGAFEKALLATACSQGWEISMFLDQRRDKVQRRIDHADQNGERFIFFMDRREKTGADRLCVLNPLAVECLKKYLAVRVDDDPRLFPITADGVQKMLYRLAKDANLKTAGSLRFHNIRKWLMSRLSRCQFNEFQIKFIMGKSIGISDGVYLQTLQNEIEEKYPIVYNDYLNICWKPNISGGGGQQVFNVEEIKRIKDMLEAFEAGKLKWVE
ncbi:MAG: hypothetical protein LBE76_01300 [Nitrososphaerota archaeon]|jgi:hypothetical protein|nr:hypothetical protein [Nitrososphaerota archaeon]